MNKDIDSQATAITNGSGAHAALDDELDIWSYIQFLLEEKWLIGGVTLIVLLIGIIYAFNATPIYRADALLQVEESKPAMKGLDEISAVFGGGAPAVAEIEIIRSRSVLGSAVDKLRLAIVAEPRYFPLFGESSARSYVEGSNLAEPVWGLSEYAWGGEKIEIQQLNLGKRYEGEDLTLTALEGNRFRLAGSNNETLIEGEVGRLEQNEAQGNGNINIFVQELFARPGTEFNVTKLSRANIIADLQGSLGVREKGRQTGILELYMEGDNPARITEIINAIANTYLRQNAERRSAEAESTLRFLNKQLPDLKARLDTAESSLNNYRSRTGSINLTLETQTLLDSVSGIEKEMQTLMLKKSGLKQRFTGDHPTLIGVARKLRQLEDEKVKLGRKIRSLPEAEQASIQLMRDVKVANELYVLLLNKAQELKVIKAGTIGNVRILDTAVLPEHPIKPRKLRIILVSIILGFIGGIISASIRHNLLRGVTDPNWVEARYGIPVYASILHSKKQSSLEKRFGKQNKENLPILAIEDSKDLSIEGLRSLRTSLRFAMMESKNNIIAISGPSPAIGKSFICVNLPYVLADTEKTVLVIDGDMRRGRVHRYFSTEKSPGLSEYISGNADLDNIVHRSENKYVSYISSGAIPPNPSELLTSDKFSKLLVQLGDKYDVILIDTPPILAVTDGILISHLAGSLFLVMKSGAHHHKEIESMLRRLSQNNIKPTGFVFNDIPSESISRYGYKYHNYEY